MLVLADSRSSDLATTGLRHDALMQLIDEMRSRRKLVVIAACHSGAGKSRLGERLAEELRGLKGPFFEQVPEVNGEGRIILAASAWGEPAREDAELENDIYTHFFIQALHGFDRNQDGATTALEAHDYARRRTIEYTSGAQRPTLSAELVGEEPIVLRGQFNHHGDPLIAAFGSSFEGATLFVDGQVKGTLPGVIPVSQGPRTILVARDARDLRDPLLEVELDLLGPAVVSLDELFESGANGRIGDPMTRPSWSAHLELGPMFIHHEYLTESFIPSHPILTIGIDRWSRWRRAAVGLEASLGHAWSDVTVGVDHVPTSQSVTYSRLGARGLLRATPPGPFGLSLGLRFGWSVGSRSFDNEVVSADLFSFVSAGLTLSTEYDLGSVNVVANASLDALFVPSEDRVTSALADQYSVGIMKAF
jgi:hypothetical protein